MPRKVVIVILALAVLIPVHAVKASEIRAFHNSNQLPFKQIFGLPSLDNLPLTEAGKWRLNVIANVSNTSDFSAAADEQAETDVETSRATLIVNYGLRPNWQVSLEVPYIKHSGGFLDDFIYGWHDFFNLPQSGRTEDNADQLHVSYLSGSGSSFQLPGSESGLGDIRLNSAFTRPWHDRAVILSAELKLPTGDYDKLTGSGGYDFSLGLTINDPYSLEKYGIGFFGGMAAVFLGDADGDLAALQKNFVLVGRAGIGWQATKLIQFKLQLDAQSALYDSDLKEMGDPALQLLMGGSLTFTENVYLDISVAEDINSGTAPDVALQLALAVTF